MPLRLELLGQPFVVFNGLRKAVPVTKPASLLLYLAYRADWVSRSELAFLYRSEVTELEALEHLRKQIYRARQYAWANNLEVTESGLRWLVDTDVKDFQKALNTQNWHAALELFKAPLLYGFGMAGSPAYSAWLELEQSDLERQKVTVIWKCIEAFERDGCLADALGLLDELRKRNPLDEEVLQTQLRVLKKDNRQAEALSLYEMFCNQLKVELDVEPLESTQVLIDSFEHKKSARQSSKNLYSRHNLPAHTTSFIGRESELKNIANKINDKECRLLTLIGLGGIGKTRLSLEVAQRQLEHYKDGVYFVPLAGVNSINAIIPTIAEQLGLTFTGSEKPETQLVEFLKTKEMLLLLDNFEHLRDGTDLLESLLAQCSNLNLLVSSREALELTSEWLFDVQGLSVPPETFDGPPEQFEAVSLFISRAKRISPHFIENRGTLNAIAEISRFVEGLPLALELTASWTRSMSCETICSTLKDNLDLLYSTHKNIPERQRSIESIFNYSYEQLTLPEQLVLVKLTIFEGSFDFDAAKLVARAHLNLLLKLMNHSLLRRNKEGRFTLHELLRQFLSRKLTKNDSMNLEKLFGHHYLQKLSEHGNDLRGLTPKATQEYLLQDIGNIRKAYTLSVEAKNWSLVDQAHEGLKQLFFTTGLFEEASTMYQQLLQKLELIEALKQPQGLSIKTKLGLMRARFQLNDIQLLEELRILSKDLANSIYSEAYAESLYLLGLYLHDHQDHINEAEKVNLQCFDLLKKLEHSYLQQDILERLAHTAWFKGNYPQTVCYLKDWLKLSEERQDASSIVMAAQTLSNRLKYVGASHDEREDLLVKAMVYQNDISDYLRAGLLNDYALSFYDKEEYITSERLLKNALELILKTSDMRDSAVISFNLARVFREQKKFQAASDMFHHSMQLCLFGALQYAALAENERLQSNYLLAKDYLKKALDSYDQQKQPVNHLLDAFACLAHIYEAEENSLAAYELVHHIYHNAGSGQHQKEQIEALYNNYQANLDSRVMIQVQKQSKSLDSILKEQLSFLK